MTPSHLQRAAAAELLRQEEALDSLSSFRAYMAGTGSADFAHAPARHHLLIMQHLERLERGEIKRLMILAPPASAKSTYSSIQYPLWRLARQPHRNILCASNTEELAKSFNRRRRSVALTPHWMRLADTKLADDLQSVEHFGTAKGGGIRAAGVGSTITGFRSHMNILDDPIKGHEEAMSGTALDKQWDWYHSDFRTRLEPGCPELVVSTRWARRDIAGRLLESEGDQWTVLRLPMIADSPDDPLGRAEGDILWPEFFQPAFVAEKQRSPLMWSTLYQQTPLDKEGAWIGVEHIQYADHQPLGEPYKVIAVDLALSVGKGDYTVFVVGQLDADRVLHVIEVVRHRRSVEESVDVLFDLCSQHQPMEVLIEDDPASKVFKTLVGEVARTRRRPVWLRDMPMRGKEKEIRAAPLRGLFKMGQVRLLRNRPWTEALVRELLEFPSGVHDDQVDALGLICRRYPALRSPAKVIEACAPEKRDLLIRPSLQPDGTTKLTLQLGLNQLFEDRERTLRANRGRL